MTYMIVHEHVRKSIIDTKYTLHNALQKSTYLNQYKCISNNLTWQTHIDNICEKAKQTLARISPPQHQSTLTKTKIYSLSHSCKTPTGILFLSLFSLLWFWHLTNCGYSKEGCPLDDAWLWPYIQPNRYAR